MIEYIIKDITTIEKGVILQGVNTKGVMGSGIALAIRRKWPYVYDSYKENGTGVKLLGTTEFLLPSENSQLVIANGYTQENYGNDGKRYADPDAVSKCVSAAVECADALELPVYMPKIGCGLGGLDWDNEVKPSVEKASLAFPDVNIFICDL